MAQNFCAIFKIGQKRPKKLPNATKTLKKLPNIAHNFYIYVLKQEAQSRKRPGSSSLPHLQAPAQSHCPSSSAGTSTGEESPGSSPCQEILREEYPPSSPPSFSLNTSSLDRKDALPSSLTLNLTPSPEEIEEQEESDSDVDVSKEDVPVEEPREKGIQVLELQAVYWFRSRHRNEGRK